MFVRDTAYVRTCFYVFVTSVFELQLFSGLKSIDEAQKSLHSFIIFTSVIPKHSSRNNLRYVL